MDYLKPPEVVAALIDSGTRKAALPIRDLLVRGALSGAILGIATTLAITAAIQTGVPLAGALIFPVGFVMIVLLNLELVTGSFAVLPMAQMAGAINLAATMRNWTWAFVGNLAGSLLFAFMLWGALTMFGDVPGGAVGERIAQIADAKTLGYAAHGGAGWAAALVKAMLCNWMVCMGVVMAVLGLMILGVSVGVLRTGALARWVGWLGVGCAVPLLLATLAQYGALLTLLAVVWSFGLAVALWQAPQPSVTSATVASSADSSAAASTVSATP